jgi:hypothetical protein
VNYLVSLTRDLDFYEFNLALQQSFSCGILPLLTRDWKVGRDCEKIQGFPRGQDMLQGRLRIAKKGVRMKMK